MKRIIGFLVCVSVSLVMLFSGNTAYAAELEENERIHEEIVALYEERARLSANWAENESRINEIDNLVAELGVTKATEEDLAKLYNFKGRVAVLGECYGTNVTQERYVTNYNGTMVELQIIRVVPEGAYGEMYHSDVTEEKEISIANAVSNVFFKCVVPAGLSSVPVIGTSISAVITGAQILSELNAELNCTTMKASAYFDYTAISSEVWIYVKNVGSTDATQILCYNGNEIFYEGRYICKGLEFEGNTPQTTRYESVKSGYVKSTNYDNCDNKAKSNFFNYKNYNTTFNPDEHVFQINVTMNNTNHIITFYKVGFPM